MSKWERNTYWRGGKIFESKKADTPGDKIKKERCIEGFGENALTRDTVWKMQA